MAECTADLKTDVLCAAILQLCSDQGLQPLTEPLVQILMDRNSSRAAKSYLKV